jgi:hypothetical protein
MYLIIPEDHADTAAHIVNARHMSMDFEILVVAIGVQRQGALFLDLVELTAGSRRTRIVSGATRGNGRGGLDRNRICGSSEHAYKAKREGEEAHGCGRC